LEKDLKITKPVSWHIGHDCHRQQIFALLDKAAEFYLASGSAIPYDWLVMKILYKLSATTLLFATCTLAETLSLHASALPPVPSQSSTAPRTYVLTREQASQILPPSVFFRGQSASIQGRNSAGLRLANGKLILVAIVDTSGYSSALQQTYQAYLITEVPLLIGGQHLSAGAYGFGFIANNKMTVMDIGGNEVLHIDTVRDESLSRPNPLQILPNINTHAYRLYLGRTFVTLLPAGR
jgi:hypothetical protein